MIIEISIAVIALAFVILVIYLITLISSLRVTLGQVNNTLVEAQKVVEHTNQISYDLKQKSEALNPVFNAISSAGEVLERKASTLKKEYIAMHEDEEFERLHCNSEEKRKFQNSEGFATIAAVLELAGLGVSLWQKLKKRR